MQMHANYERNAEKEESKKRERERASERASEQIRNERSLTSPASISDGIYFIRELERCASFNRVLLHGRISLSK